MTRISDKVLTHLQRCVTAVCTPKPMNRQYTWTFPCPVSIYMYMYYIWFKPRLDQVNGKGRVRGGGCRWHMRSSAILLVSSRERGNRRFG